MEEPPEPPGIQSAKLKIPSPPSDTSRRVLLRQQAARIKQSLSPKHLRKTPRIPGTSSRKLLSPIPETRAIRQRLSYSLDSVDGTTSPQEGKRKRRGSRKTKLPKNVKGGTVTESDSKAMEEGHGNGMEEESSPTQDLSSGGASTTARTEIDGDRADETPPTDLRSEHRGDSEQPLKALVRTEEAQVVGDTSHNVKSGQEERQAENPTEDFSGKGDGTCDIPTFATEEEDCTEAGILPHAAKTSPVLESDMVDSSLPNGSQDMVLFERQPTNPPNEERLNPCFDQIGDPTAETPASNLAFSEDILLDLAASQPLQLHAGALLTSPTCPASPTLARDDSSEDEDMSNTTEDAAWDTNFPPLTKGHIQNVRANFERSGDILEPNRKNVSDLRRKTQQDHDNQQPKVPSIASEGRIVPAKGTENAWTPRNGIATTGVDLLKGNGGTRKVKEAITFEPTKIKKIGFAGESAGIPSIYFSKADNDFLANQLGHAIVGKFSHSIPTSQQIQKALDSLKFVGSFSWTYINAKHVLIQLDHLADYAKLLGGPNGTPVWFLDHHPMRVFKWTTEFDPFFETPSAAVWCNLIGLPIHLFEESALFAIGGLLGNPIQVDHDTSNRSRLSFARICVEIDISKRPPEEIILDIQGRETRQKVKWDRIPLYCTECRHVGHARERCYAFGKGPPPPARNYGSYGHQHRAQAPQRPRNQREQPHGGRKQTTGVQGQMQGRNIDVTQGIPTSTNTFQILARNSDYNGSDPKSISNTGRAMSSSAAFTTAAEEQVDDEGFQVVHRRKGKHTRHKSNEMASGYEGSPSTQLRWEEGLNAGSSRSLSPHREGGTSSSYRGSDASPFTPQPNRYMKPKYYKPKVDGTFDTEEFEEDMEMEEEDPGGLVLTHVRAQPVAEAEGESTKRRQLENGNIAIGGGCPPHQANC